MAKWFNAEVLVPQTYSIAFYNLPDETDAPAFIRMLTDRGINGCALTEVEKVDVSEKPSNTNTTKNNFKRKLSFRLSCKSEEDMKHAIKTLKAKEGGFDLDVSALVTENLPTENNDQVLEMKPVSFKNGAKIPEETDPDYFGCRPALITHLQTD